MESLSIWSLAGVISNSAVIMAIRLSTQSVWHTFNYDVTVSNGVNLCHPFAADKPTQALTTLSMVYLSCVGDENTPQNL